MLTTGYSPFLRPVVGGGRVGWGCGGGAGGGGGGARVPPCFDLDQGRYYATPLAVGAPQPVRISDFHMRVLRGFKCQASFIDKKQII